MCNCLYVEGRGASDSKGTGFSVEHVQYLVQFEVQMILEICQYDLHDVSCLWEAVLFLSLGCQCAQADPSLTLTYCRETYFWQSINVDEKAWSSIIYYSILSGLL
jgi:hypothetical protein